MSMEICSVASVTPPPYRIARNCIASLDSECQFGDFARGAAGRPGKSPRWLEGFGEELLAGIFIMTAHQLDGKWAGNCLTLTITPEGEDKIKVIKGNPCCPGT